MRSWRAFSIVTSLAAAAGCTAILGDFTVNATGGPGGDGGGVDGGGLSDGQGADGNGTGDGGTTEGGGADAGAWSCSFFPSRKLLDYTDSTGNRARVSDFGIFHMPNTQDARVFLVFPPNSGGNNDIRSLSFRTKNTTDTVQLETTPSARPVVFGHSGGAVYVFTEERPVGTNNPSIFAYKVDDQSNGALATAAQSGGKSNALFPVPTTSFNTHYAGTAIDTQGNFNIGFGTQTQTTPPTWDVYMVPNVSWSSSLPTIPPAFTNVNAGNNFSLDGAGVFRAGSHVYMLLQGVDATNATQTYQHEFPLGQSSPTTNRPLYPGQIFPILFNPTGTAQLDVGVAIPSADAAVSPFDVYFGRVDETRAMTFNPVTDLHSISLFADPDKSPIGQQMGCFSTFPGTMMFVGRGQTPGSTGANVYMFDIPTATTKFAAAGSGQNLLTGNTKFNRCGMDYAGPSPGGAQNWDVVWAEPGDASETYDELWYAGLYCKQN